MYSKHWECGRAPTPARLAGCPCYVLQGTGGQRNCCIEHRGCTHKPSHGCIAARTARAEICTCTRSHVGAHVGDWACTLLVPACWRAFKRSGRGDFDGERSALGLGRPHSQHWKMDHI